MKQADAEAEMTVLEKLVKATDNVRAKYRALQKGKQDDDKVLSDMFKHVVSPLNKIVERIAPSEREGSDREPQVDLLARMRQLLSKPEQDIYYAIRQTSKKLMIGNAKVNSDPQNFYIGEKTYPATHGLVELLCKKEPNLTLVTEADNAAYKTILLDTNAHKYHHRSYGEVRVNNTPKFQLVSQLIGYKGKGLALPMLVKPDYKPEYIYWDDPNELVERLRLLTASYQAGNTAHSNEIMSILEELREANYIE